MIVPSRSIVKPREVGDLLHLSFNNKLEGKWSPILPAGSELNQVGKYPEPSIPRISLSPTVEQCFRAIYPNIDFYFTNKKYPYLDIYAYMPKFTGRERIVNSHTLTNNRWVWDAHITEEHWVLDNVEMILVSHYRFYNMESEVESLLTHPFNDRREPSRSMGPLKIQHALIKTFTSLESKSPIFTW